MQRLFILVCMTAAACGQSYICSEVRSSGRVTITANTGIADATCNASVVQAKFSYGVSSIAAGAFAFAPHLEEALFPTTLTVIGQSAFQGTPLLYIQIPYSVESIEPYAFADCSSAQTIQINNGVGVIGAYAFARITGVGTLVLPESVHEVENGAFSEMTGLDTLIATNPALTLGAQVFKGCTSLQNFWLQTSDTVGSEVLDGNTCNVAVVSSLTYSYKNCNQEPDNTWTTGYMTTGFCNPTATSTLLYAVDIEDSVGDVLTIPKNVPSNAFSGAACKGSLVHVELQESVTSIADAGFFESMHLTTVNIPDSVTYIGTSAFQDCIALTQVTIPGSVTSIAPFSFKGCSSLVFVRLLVGTISIGNNAFAAATMLPGIFLPTTINDIGDWAFSETQTMETFISWNDSLSIGGNAFDRSNLQNVFINNCAAWNAGALFGSTPTVPGRINYYGGSETTDDLWQVLAAQRFSVAPTETTTSTATEITQTSTSSTFSATDTSTVTTYTGSSGTSVTSTITTHTGSSATSSTSTVTTHTGSTSVVQQQQQLPPDPSSGGFSTGALVALIAGVIVVAAGIAYLAFHKQAGEKRSSTSYAFM
jgi:PKD repeat protein